MPGIILTKHDARALARPATRWIASWPWLNRIWSAWLLTMLLLVLGVLTLAAVRELSIECRREPNYLLTEKGHPLAIGDGTGYLLVDEKKHLRCRIAWGNAFDIFLP
jgi:hypothetical protein